MKYLGKIYGQQIKVHPYQISEINGFLGEFKVENNKNILIDMGILCGEQYRESILDYGIYDYVEKWNKTTGIAKDGIIYV